ncbi:MAG: hypothetical protein IPK26_15145 [Planctomycetes bacterium]|nr:hypothetical protein [Planctomycetota bacterium]
MKKKLKDALHRYKVEDFKMSHHGAAVAEVSREIVDHTRQALENAYHVHLKDPNPHRVELFQMIKEFTLESFLPPVLEKVMRRITVLEHQHTQLVKLLDELMEALSEDEPTPQKPAHR